MAAHPSPVSSLPRRSFVRPVLELAAALLGQLLVRRERSGALTIGRIVETEAYGGVGVDDSAHSFAGPTPRCAVMFGPPGHAYVYATQGRCCCLNVSAAGDGDGRAVLLRAVEPLAGNERMRRRRLARLGDGPTRRLLQDGNDHALASGPGRLCLSFDIDRRLDGSDLTDRDGALFLARGETVDDVLWTPRVGLNPRLQSHGWPWRALDAGSDAVPAPRRGAGRR